MKCAKRGTWGGFSSVNFAIKKQRWYDAYKKMMTEAATNAAVRKGGSP